MEPSYEELAASVAELTALLERADTQIAALLAEVAKLRAQAGTDSSNSSAPPSKDSIGAKARRRAERVSDASQRQRSADRKPGGQAGHQGSGLDPTRDPDRSEWAAAPVACPCGQGLSDVDDVGTTWAQVWDIAPVELERVHWVLPRRRCGCCAKTSTAVVPFAQPGAVVYGPNVNAAAVLLASQGNVPLERAAVLMAALLGAPVSAGFVARALARLADRLTAAGFDEAMAAALSAEAVLGADESPVHAENAVHTGQAACWYSWRMPPSRSRRRMSRRSSCSGVVIGWGSGRRGAAAGRVRWDRCSL